MGWPPRIDRAVERAYTLDHVYKTRNRFLEDPEKATSFLSAERFVCGFGLPPFQREAVWQEERAVGFVENVILGHHPGHWQLNRNSDSDLVELADGRSVWLYDNWLLDGQQRLIALDSYWFDRFPVFDLYWSEVPVRDQRRFLSTSFAASEHRISDYGQLVDLYHRINRGGVPHTDAEMAIARRPD